MEHSPGGEKPVVWSSRVADHEPYGERFRAFVAANRDEEGATATQSSNHGGHPSVDPMEYVRRKRQESHARRKDLKSKLKQYQEQMESEIERQRQILEEETQYKSTESTSPKEGTERDKDRDTARRDRDGAEDSINRRPPLKSHGSHKEFLRAPQSSQSSRESSASTTEGNRGNNYQRKQ